LTLDFETEGQDWVAHHAGVEYRVVHPKGVHFGEFRILRNGEDWTERTYNTEATAMDVAADIAQATGSKKKNPISQLKNKLLR